MDKRDRMINTMQSHCEGNVQSNLVFLVSTLNSSKAKPPASPKKAFTHPNADYQTITKSWQSLAQHAECCLSFIHTNPVSRDAMYCVSALFLRLEQVGKFRKQSEEKLQKLFQINNN